MCVFVTELKPYFSSSFLFVFVQDKEKPWQRFIIYPTHSAITLNISIGTSNDFTTGYRNHRPLSMSKLQFNDKYIDCNIETSNRAASRTLLEQEFNGGLKGECVYEVRDNNFQCKILNYLYTCAEFSVSTHTLGGDNFYQEGANECKQNKKFIVCCVIYWREIWGSSVSIASDYRLDDWGSTSGRNQPTKKAN
jgi:hypothetical protein